MLPDINKILKPRPRKYRHLVKHLSPALLTLETPETTWSEEEVFMDLTTHRGTAKVLGYYSVRGVELALEHFGIIDHLNRVGLPNAKTIMDTSNPYQSKLQIKHSIDHKLVLSCECILRRGTFLQPGVDLSSGTAREYIIVEWILLQHPLKPFTRRRRQLPGQDHPGLGISDLIFELLYWTSRRLQIDGVILIPNYLHTGLFYGRHCLFLDPVKQGQLAVLGKYLSTRTPLHQLSWACAEGQLIDWNPKKPFLWKPAPMALPVSKKLKDYFHTKDYVQKTRQIKQSFRVRINPGYRKHFGPDWRALP